MNLRELFNNATVVCWIGLIFLHAVLGTASEPQPEFDAGHPKLGAPIDPEKLQRLAWGPAATNGLRAACYFEPIQDAYADGEVLKRRVVIHNSGRESVLFTVGLGGNDDGWTVVDERDQKVPFHHVTYTGLVPLKTFLLQPGHVTEIDCLSVGMGASTKAGGGLTDTAIQAKPGTTCRVRWTLRVAETTRKEDGKRVPVAGAWHGTLTTGEVRFRIVEPGAAPKSETGQARFEAVSKDAFIVFGKVTDAQGQPMSEVEVRAYCGMGTLLGGGHTTTDANGDYRLPFRGGCMMPRSDAAPLGVSFQVATVRAGKPGYFLQALGRAGHLAMTDQTNPVPGWATNYAGIVRPFTPYRLDFTLLPAASVQGELFDPDGKLPRQRSLSLTGATLPPSQSVLESTNVVVGRRFQFTEVPVGFEWWFEVQWREGDAWQSACSQPFAFHSSEARRVRLTLTAQGVLEMTEQFGEDK